MGPPPTTTKKKQGQLWHSVEGQGLGAVVERRSGSSPYTLRKENQYLCFFNMKHFSPGFKIENSVSGMSQKKKKNARRGLLRGCSQGKQ